MNHFSTKPQGDQSSRLETIQQLNQLLTTAQKAAGGSLDPEVVNKLLSSFCETPATPTVSPILEEGKAEIPPVTPEYIEEKAGIQIPSWGKDLLKKELKNVSISVVERAIKKYTGKYGYGGGDTNPAGLFYDFLKKEIKNRSK